MEYTGNQLKFASDDIADIQLNASPDFKEYTKGTGVEYTYNTNGAMIKDLNKGISQIQYNNLNLPRIVDIKNRNAEGRNEYTYSASGQKLKVMQKWNPNYLTAPVIGSDINVSALTKSTSTDYIGNIIYEDGALKRILVDGGYNEDGNYYFYMQDHLGNNRIVADAAASVKQSTHYYPFGMPFADATGKDIQPYKYNGKELDTRNGLNMYDYGARYLAMDIPVLPTVDPLAEKYYSWSPYAYVLNNPLKYIDPTGEGPIDGLKSILKSITGYDLGSSYYYKPIAKSVIWAQSNKSKAWAIGASENSSKSITATAFRFSNNLNVVDGTKSAAFTNAVRHTTWQAMIANEFDIPTAMEVGNSHETEEWAEWKYAGTSSVDDFDLSDNIVDARNNAIGRDIGENNPTLNRKELAGKVLEHYKDKGLWVVRVVQLNDRTTYRLVQMKLTTEEYNNAMRRLNELDDNGFEKK